MRRLITLSSLGATPDATTRGVHAITRSRQSCSRFCTASSRLRISCALRCLESRLSFCSSSSASTSGGAEPTLLVCTPTEPAVLLFQSMLPPPSLPPPSPADLPVATLSVLVEAEPLVGPRMYASFAWVRW